MIRVLHVVGGLNVGGTETWLAKGLPAIDRSQYQFDFLIHNDGPQHYRAELEANGARVLSCPSPRNLFSYARSFLRIIRENGYQAVHAHTYCFSGIVLALAAVAGVRLRIFHSHTAQDESRDGKLRAAYFRLSRWLIQHFATRGVAVSAEAARGFFPCDWRRYPDRWMISPIGIDLSPFRSPVDRDAVRKELNIPPDATVIVHVGRFVPVKNHHFLIAIAQEVVNRDLGVIFLLVGDGPGRDEIEQQVKSLGLTSNFRFAGIRTDVPRLLQACNVFVLQSWYEGFPLSYIEAQAAGLPCVISDVIAAAADSVPQRTVRHSLESSPRLWAQSLLDSARLERICQVPSQLSSVSIERSMERVLECYR